MNDYRSLTVEEIEHLEQRGCRAEDWTRVNVAEDFSPEWIDHVAFYGDVCLGVFDKQIEVAEGFFRHAGISHAVLCDVSIGDNCLIENIGEHICRYTIGEECYIAHVGTMLTTEGATYGQGNVVAVKNEAGQGNVIVYDGLTSQVAALMISVEKDRQTWGCLRRLAERHVAEAMPERGTIGYGVKIVNTRELVNVWVGDDCEINGASRISESTLLSVPESSTYIGCDVVCDNTVIQAGASVTDGAKLDNCFVGEACHAGKGFSAESSLFFANSYMDNGEACAAFCGPFTVSHHKSTLLIGGEYSFYNAGSATNFSNHAYKLGPLHHGTLQRGCKTASGSHILWPAQTGVFSVCLGKIQNHPDLRQLPFSYVIGDGSTTWVVPGRNLCTVGTWRDTAKWPKRDMRPHTGRRSLVNFDWLSPYTMSEVLHAKRLLENLQTEQGEQAALYTWQGCCIKRIWLVKGIQLYTLAIRLYLGKAVEGHYCELPESSVGTGDWVDLAGLLAPETEIVSLEDDLRKGAVDSVQLLEERFSAIHRHYTDYKWNFTYRMALSWLGIDTLTEDEVDTIEADYVQACQEWKTAVQRDAEKEFAMGDVDEAVLTDFLEKLGK